MSLRVWWTVSVLQYTESYKAKFIDVKISYAVTYNIWVYNISLIK